MSILDRFRRDNAAAPAPAGSVLGTDGEPWWATFVGGGPDENPELTGNLKFDVYDRMAISDYACKALLWMHELPIAGAVWDFEPVTSDPFDELVAEACRWQFGVHGYEGQLARSWKATLRQKQLKNRYGAMFEEIIWAADTVEFVPKGDSGAARTLRPITRLAPRSPRTIRSVDFKDGEIQKITQNVSNTAPIPGGRDARKLIYGVVDERPGRWDGTSLLRAAWGPWKLKTELMIAAGIAWDRWASGIPVVRYPAGGGANEEAKANEFGRAIRNHERSYLSFAGPPPDAQNPNGWDLEIKGGPGNLPDPVDLMKHYDLAILWCGLLQWMGIATSSRTGARATAQVQDEPYYMAIELEADDLAVEMQRQDVRYFVDVNFGTEIPAPKLTVSKIQSEDVAALATTLSNFKLAGLDFSDIDTQNDIRERLHLPELPEDTVVETAEGDGLPAPPPAPPAAGGA